MTLTGGKTRCPSTPASKARHPSDPWGKVGHLSDPVVSPLNSLGQLAGCCRSGGNKNMLSENSEWGTTLTHYSRNLRD
ncbi:hypothetical protein Pmani_028124 [Petrolisthes manimaculis]|uniref:Uncharacterized protein n=1 Tax=Petrolisthes manimaculis TaxID=1843537 RepID=A0AAE1TV48_9EUCA|nr:hypothetical protein Pmani_028124 [Petrolisthes manimaculis]